MWCVRPNSATPYCGAGPSCPLAHAKAVAMLVATAPPIPLVTWDRRVRYDATRCPPPPPSQCRHREVDGRTVPSPLWTSLCPFYDASP